MKKWMIAFGMMIAHLNAAWNPPVFVSTAGEQVVVGPGPDMDANTQNNGVAVWVFIDPDFFSLPEIKASNYVFGSGWSTPVIISSLELDQNSDPFYGATNNPAVALNNLGYAVAVWEGHRFDDEDTFYNIYSASRSPDGSFSPQQLVNPENTTDTSYFPHNPNVDINDSGLAVAVWLETREDLPYVMSAFMGVGGSWTLPTQLDAPVSQTTEDTPDVRINQAGDVVAAWRKDGPVSIAVGTFSSATSTWSSPVTLDVTTLPVSLPRVGIDEKGNAVAIWSRDQSEVVVSYFSNGSGWSLPAVIYSGNQIEGPEIVMDPLGNATAAWADDNVVYSAALPLGGTWSTPQVILNGAGIDQELLVQRPMAVDLNGNVILLVYVSNEDNTKTLQSISKFVSSGWQAPETIVTLTDFFEESVALGSCGFALALWQNLEVDNDLVQAADNLSLYAPVLNFSGSTCCERFAFQKACFNTLTWDLDPCAVQYLLYRNGVLIATLPANIATFTEPVCVKGPVTYTLIAVSSLNGTLSPPATVVLP